MSTLNVNQQSIYELFSDKKSNFLIPDYQRPYAWGISECATLWEDVCAFAIPDEDCDKFNEEKDQYFLGPTVSFRNGSKLEIIDGQQRITTLTLMLRACYDKLLNMKDKKSVRLRDKIEECIWKGGIDGDANDAQLKIESQVATDDDKAEFLDVLRTGCVKKEYESRYAKAFRFFQEAVGRFTDTYPSYFNSFLDRILNNCILLSIEAESQDTALRIFSTLNDRGRPLSDSDIFKAQFYKFFDSNGKKDLFIAKWKDLEEICGKIFSRINGAPLDELFTRYMYYLRAKQGIKNTTTEALRNFYEKGNYEFFKNEGAFEDLIALAYFWRDVETQNNERFSEEILKRLFVLHYAPNAMWTFLTSVYFMHNRDGNGMLDDKAFLEFLNKTIAFIWSYTFVSPGIGSLRTPIYPEMVNIVQDRPIEFARHKFNMEDLRARINRFDFLNGRPITKAMLAWRAFQNPNQPLIPRGTKLQVEHIYAKGKYEKDHSLTNPKLIELLGNKALLEEGINRVASDSKFTEKAKYYQGKAVNKRGVKIEGTQNAELLELATRDDFKEEDIVERNKDFVESFLNFVLINGLMK